MRGRFEALSLARELLHSLVEEVARVGVRREESLPRPRYSSPPPSWSPSQDYCYSPSFLLTKEHSPSLLLTEEHSPSLPFTVEHSPYLLHTEEHSSSLLLTEVHCPEERTEETMVQESIVRNCNSLLDLLQTQKSPKPVVTSPFYSHMAPVLQISEPPPDAGGAVYGQNGESNCDPDDPDILESSSSPPASQQRSGIVNCTVCSKSFGSYRYMVQHRSQVHLKERKHCDNCSFEAKTDKGIEKHKEQHHTEVTCTLCNKSFQNRNELKKHKDLKHRKAYGSQSEKTFNCPVCNKPFNNRSNMNKHHKKHVVQDVSNVELVEASNYVVEIIDDNEETIGGSICNIEVLDVVEETIGDIEAFEVVVTTGHVEGAETI